MIRTCSTCLLRHAKPSPLRLTLPMHNLNRVTCIKTRSSRFWEIVGEAASRISDSTQTAHPEIPWQEIVGLRNRVVHVYFEIDLSLVWQIVREDVPALIVQLERLVPPEAG